MINTQIHSVASITFNSNIEFVQSDGKKFYVTRVYVETENSGLACFELFSNRPIVIGINSANSNTQVK